MKRLLCLLSNMNAGGAETFLMKIYRKIDRTNYQMDFCVNVYEKNFYEDEIKSLGGKLYRIPSRTKNYAKHEQALKKLIVDNKYEYILSVSSSATSFLDLRIAKQANAKVCSIRSSNSVGPSGMAHSLLNFLGKVYLKKFADHLIAPSDLAAAYLFGKKSVKNNEVVFLHNALELEKYQYNEKDRTQIRNELNIDDEKVVFGHIGRFYSQKNHIFLIDIFNEIVKKNTNALLILVGSGELQDNIKEKVNCMGLQNDVIFMGTRSDVPRLLSAMDAIVFPSFFEGMPNTIIEAQANGLPCVISSTITKEAAITDSVSFMDLSDSAGMWAEKALSIVGKRNYNALSEMKKEKYDIDSCVRVFVETVFN